MLLDYAKTTGCGRFVGVTESENKPENNTPTDNKPTTKPEENKNQNTSQNTNNQTPENEKPFVSPETGDEGILWLWFALLFVSGAGILLITLPKPKRTK